MRVVVDDSGSDDQAIRIQHLARLSIHFSDLDDPTAADGDVTVKAGQPGTINHLAVLDNQVVWHCSSYAAGKFAGVGTAVLRRKYSLTRFLSTWASGSFSIRHDS
jgi:hypothetical protein